MSGLLGGLVSQVAQGVLGGESGGLGDLVGSALGGGGDAGGFGSVVGSVLGGDVKGGIIAGLMPIVLNWIQNNDGLSGALEKAKALGLEKHVQSWMSNDENINLDSSQVTDLFGADTIAQAVAKLGSDENTVTAGIASLLPEVINKLTPQGGLENESEANAEIGQLLGKLGGLF